MSTLIDFILHIDVHLIQIVNNFGDWTYLILFAIIFVETGAVILLLTWGFPPLCRSGLSC